MKTPAALLLVSAFAAFAAAQAPSFEMHLAPTSHTNRMAVILAPGGGNSTAVVEWLNRQGFAVFVLHQTANPAADPLADLQRAIREIRARSEELGFDASRVGAMDLTPGSDTAARAALSFDYGDRNAPDPTAQQSDRPDFVVTISPGSTGGSASLPPASAPGGRAQAGNFSKRLRLLEDRRDRNRPPVFLAGGEGWQDRFVTWIRNSDGARCCAFGTECLCH